MIVWTILRIPKIGIDKDQPLVFAGQQDCCLPPRSLVQHVQRNT